MLIILYIILILYILFIKKNEKLTWLLAATMMAFLSITSETYADLNNYIPLYKFVNTVDISIGMKSTGIGWLLLNRFFNFLGFNYRGFVFVMLYVNYYLMHFSVKKLRANENMYFGLFLLFPSLIQLVQFKFFTAFCIVFLGFSFLVTSEKFPRIKYIISIIIASFIHTSSLMFILLILIKLKRYNRKVFAYISLILTIFIVLFLNAIVAFISRYLNANLTNRYFTDSITRSSTSWIIAIVLVWLFLFLVSQYIMSKREFRTQLNVSKEGMFSIANYCTMTIEVLLMTLPFLLLDRNFHRFLEFGYSSLYLILGIYVIPPKYSKSKILLTLVVIVSLIIITLVYTPFDSVLKPLFSFDGLVNLRG